MAKARSRKEHVTLQEQQGGLCGRCAERGLRRKEREREKEAMSQRTSRGLMGATQDGLSPTNNRKPLEGREQQGRTSPAPSGSSSMSVCYFPIFFLQQGERERDSPLRISSQLGKSLYVERHHTLFVEERIRNQKETGPTDLLPFLMSESLKGPPVAYRVLLASKPHLM